MLQHVLPKRGAKFQTTQSAHQLGRQIVDTRLEGGRLAGLLDLLIDVALGLLEHLLDARRVNAPVGDEVFQRDAPDLAAHGVERGQRDRLG